HAAHQADGTSGPCALGGLELPEPREHLLLGLLANGAGVEQDQIGVVRAFRELVALVPEQSCHTLGVVLVHLAAVSDQMKFRHKRPLVTLASASEGVKFGRQVQALSAKT